MLSCWGFIKFTTAICLFFFLLSPHSLATTPYIGQITPGFEASQSDWTQQGGVFLKSNNSAFGLGFYAPVDPTLFLLVVRHLYSQKLIWMANKTFTIGASDKFVFDRSGYVYLQNASTHLPFADTNGLKAKSMKLEDSGNLVLLGKGGMVVWQSFSNPTDTLISGQRFSEGMKLVSFPNKNLTMQLEMTSGDAVIYAAYSSPQVYWSMSSDTRKIIKSNSDGGKISFASLESNSWNFYDKAGLLTWQFNISEQSDQTALWIAVLGPDGSVQFYKLQEGQSVTAESTRIPANPCNSPMACAPFEVCFDVNHCQCPSALSSLPHCKLKDKPSCSNNYSNNSVVFQVVGETMDYSALAYTTPRRNTSLDRCKEACLGNCSCTAIFFDSSSNSCFLFDQIGSLQRPDQKFNGYLLAVKVPKDGRLQGSKDSKGISTAGIVIIVVTVVILSGMTCLGLCCIYWGRLKRKLSEKTSLDNSEEEDFEGFTGMPVRYRFNDLKNVTKNFSIKLGRGGFGSVYLGVQEDGSRIAVKKLEGIGQGKKEFRAEVNIIGSIHHVHLVRLRGFCAEGPHRLLVYEYMANGSLDRWIFKNDQQQGLLLNWETRYRIALGTAKGLAYLHEECEWKIVHCDIKPENVLLDEHFNAKVSDFGLAKLMNQEQSQVMTTLRGTRGYLAPEWITNYAISEKSDVYSYGMLLLEIVGGRKNFDMEMSSEKAYMPSYAFRMMEDGKLQDILDSRLKCHELDDERVTMAIKVALWCIQDDISLRPQMTKVVQMLEGLFPVPDPPVSCLTTSKIYSGLVRSVSSSAEGSNFSVWTAEHINDNGRDTMVSAERLSEQKGSQGRDDFFFQGAEMTSWCGWFVSSPIKVVKEFCFFTFFFFFFL